jgi:hypothetical protein
LEGIQVSPVICNESTGVSSFVVHCWHWGPFVIEDVEFLTGTDHSILFVTSSNYVNESIFKVIVSRKTCPTLGNWRELLHLVGSQVKLKDITHWGRTRFLGIISGNYNNSIVGYIDGAAIFQGFVELVLLLVLQVGRHFVFPFGLSLRAFFDFTADFIYRAVHDEPAGVLV